MPQYIISKLGLNRDPLAELRQDMSQLDTKGTGASVPTVEVVVEGEEEVDDADRPPQTSTPKKDEELGRVAAADVSSSSEQQQV